MHLLLTLITKYCRRFYTNYTNYLFTTLRILLKDLISKYKYKIVFWISTLFSKDVAHYCHRHLIGEDKYYDISFPNSSLFASSDITPLQSAHKEMRANQGTLYRPMQFYYLRVKINPISYKLKCSYIYHKLI